MKKPKLVVKLFLHKMYLPAFSTESSTDPYIYTPVSVRLRGDLKQTLRLLAEAADCVSDGDIVEKRIRSASQWGLLPVQVGGWARLCSLLEI